MLKSSLLYGLSLLAIAPQVCNGRAVESEKRATAALTWKALGGSIVGEYFQSNASSIECLLIQSHTNRPPWHYLMGP